MRRNVQNALTLVEVLVSIGLLAVILQLTAVLVGDVSKSTQSHNSRAEVTAGLVALRRVRAEALEAVVIHAPSEASESEVMDFEKLIFHPDRLPLIPEQWNPRESSHLSRVQYSVRGQSLQRVEVRSTNSRQAATVVPVIDSFIVSRPTSDALEFRFSFRSGKRLRSFKFRAVRFLP